MNNQVSGGEGLPAMLDCPFCGWPAKYEASAVAVNYRAACTNPACNLVGPDGSDDASAITAWNTRYSAKAAEGELGELMRLSELATPGDFYVKHDLNVFAGDDRAATSLASNMIDVHQRNTNNAAYLVAAANFIRQHASRIAGVESIERELLKLCSWKHLMSYNDSYFGEPSGELKSLTYEIERKLPVAAMVAARAGHSTPTNQDKDDE